MTAEPEVIPADVRELARNALADFAETGDADVFERAIMADRTSRSDGPKPVAWVCAADIRLVAERDGYDISVSPRQRTDLGMNMPLYTHPAPASPDADWRDDPSADERWNAGLDFGMEQLCKAIGVDPQQVTWDAATETLDGDVQSVIWNILRTAYGEDFPPAPWPDAEMVRALSGLIKAIGNMRVPQNVADVAMLVMVTLGPALSHAQDILSKHGGDR